MTDLERLINAVIAQADANKGQSNFQELYIVGPELKELALKSKEWLEHANDCP